MVITPVLTDPRAVPCDAAPTNALPVTIALQGGGALGAFSWGVLDRLLEDPRLRVAAISGASAGAMNAALTTQGLATGGPDQAKHLLESFWRRVAFGAGSPDLDAAAWMWPFDAVFNAVSDALRHAAFRMPNSPPIPHGVNPLRRVLGGLLEPAAFAANGAPALVVSATRVRTGEARLFWNEEVTADVLLASACLPEFFTPVEIDGELFWDGGFVSNPPLRPLIEAGAPSDVILVPTGPWERPEPPHRGADIRERAAEIAFNSALRQELRSLGVAQRLLEELPFPPPPGGGLARLREARLHMISADEEFLALPSGSALDARWPFLRRLRDMGRHAAEQWLRAHMGEVGHRSTLDLAALAATREHSCHEQLR